MAYTAAQKKDFVTKANQLIESGSSLNAASKELGVSAKALKAWIATSGVDTDSDVVTEEAPKTTKSRRKTTAAKTKATKATKIVKAATKRSRKPVDSEASKARSLSRAKKKEAYTKATEEQSQDVAFEVTLKVIRITGNIVVAINGQSHEVRSTHEKYAEIDKLLNLYGDGCTKEQAAALTTLIVGEKVERIAKWTKGKLVIDNGQVLWEGKPIIGGLKTILIRHAESGDEAALSAFSNFIAKVRQCVSYKVNQRFFEFISKNSLKIDADGDILAFKVVRENYFDKHTGTFNNSIGTTVEMPRNEVDDQDSNTCSAGLHICSADYIGSFSNNGDRVVVVKVNPMDIVSIPTDYSSSKCRTCRYTVIKDVTAEWKAGTIKEYTENHK